MKSLSHIFFLIAPIVLMLNAAGAEKRPKEIETLILDFRGDFRKAKEQPDKILQNEGSKVVSKLVQEGRSNDATEVASQIKEKIAGNPLPDPHSELIKLFEGYDKAVTSSTKPIRDRYLGRTDNLIRFYEGKNIDAILALAELRKEIQGVSTDASNVPKVELEKMILGKWLFVVGGYRMKREILENGSLIADIGGKWRIENQQLKVEYANGAWVAFTLPPQDDKMTGKTNRNEDLIATRIKQE